MKRLISIAVWIGLLSSILQAVSRFCLAYLSSGMTKVIRSEIYKSLINKTALYFDDDQNSVGRIIEILAVQTKDLNGASFEQYINFYQGLIVWICWWVISVVFRWNEGLAVWGFIQFLIVSCFFVTQFQIAKTKKIYKYGDINKISENAAIHDCIVNNLTIASLSNEDTIIERYFISSHSNNLRKRKYAEVIKMSCLYAFSQFLITMFYVPMYFIFAYNVENKENIIHSSIPLVCGMIGGLYFSTLLFNSPDFSSGKKSANTIFNIIEEKNEGEPESIIVDGDLELTKEIASGDIEFKNIWFKYPTSWGDWVLKNFNLKIKAGTSVGLVGESGSGKSTLVQLLLRFYDPQRGEILIGGIPITKFTLNSLRRACGFVQQKPQIFDRSILENIWYGKPHATVEEINQAAIMSNSKEFIENISMNDNEVEILNSQINTDDRYMDLDNGYKIIWGPKGNKLSGGQKQRIAIARAVIRNPSILILDEATSALDEASQAVVQESINNLMRTTTSIVIAHRLSTLSRWDKIFKICEGTIVDRD